MTHNLMTWGGGGGERQASLPIRHRVEFTKVQLGLLVPQKLFHFTYSPFQVLSAIKKLYLGVCAKVKRRCREMLRLMRSLRNSSGELRGESRGESQGDILGDPLGELNGDCGFSLMGWELLSGKETASPELSHRASLILQGEGFNKPSLVCWGVSLPTGGPNQPSQSSSVLRENKIGLNSALHTLKHLWSTSALLLGNLHRLFFQKAICSPCWWTQTWVQEGALPSAVSSVYTALSSA